MEDTVKIAKSVEELVEDFTSLLLLHISETPGDRTFSWVLSGGSTPKMMFRKIASEARDVVDWEKVKIFWGDERCVSPDDNDSNFKMARENFLDHVPIPSYNIFRIYGEKEPVAEAGRYSEIFRKHVGMDHGITRADFIMLGLGEDGHTASIFPSDIDLFNSEKLFEVTEHPGTKQKRITATGKIINNAKLVVILVTGEPKSSRVAQILNKLNGWDQLPAARIRPEKGKVIWLIDRQAAITLNTSIKNEK